MRTAALMLAPLSGPLVRDMKSAKTVPPLESYQLWNNEMEGPITHVACSARDEYILAHDANAVNLWDEAIAARPEP